MRRALVLLLACLASGCTRAWYRTGADRETYATIDERGGCPEWALPTVSIEPAPGSRLHDAACPDRPPLPPDDPAAKRFMDCPNGIRGSRKWYKQGTAADIEDPAWRSSLDAGPDGTLTLTPASATALGVVNSREYQTALEELYLSGLTLTLNRFEFALQWFGRNRTIWDHFGSSRTEVNTLTTASNVGFTRTLAAGGQFAADLANTWVFSFKGQDDTTVTTNLGLTFLQPLLRGACREVRLESLTQAERNTLYAVRDFARFRKVYAVDVYTGPGGYLQLLLLLQSIRNREANLASLEQNLRLHEALYKMGNVSSVKVEQVFQGYQQGRFGLLQARIGLENRLDEYKITLGLPPGQPVKLDDALLEPFQLASSELTSLQNKAETLAAKFREPDAAPPLEQLKDGFQRLLELRGQTEKIVKQVEEELGRWKKDLADNGVDKAVREREEADRRNRARDLSDVTTDLAALEKVVKTAAADLRESGRAESWATLQRLIRKQTSILDVLYILQTQVRVYLIRLPAVPWKEADAVGYALGHRLDLMNRRAQVVDNWRRITVAADALETNFDVFFGMNLVTKPGGANPVDFRASASDYRLGFQLDTPLNRLAERNNYRASLINYQRSRRSYMALEDRITQAIRRDLRQLETEALNFAIARQSLLSAARQVEAAREDLLVGGAAADPTATQNVLIALNALLQAREALVGSWVNYQTFRTQLLLDLDYLQVDERGTYTDEHDQPGSAPAKPAP